MLPDELETNEYALSKTASTIQTNSFVKENDSFMSLLKKNFKIVKENIKDPLITKFFSFLIFQGLVMPSFANYEYYFAVDHLGIS